MTHTQLEHYQGGFYGTSLHYEAVGWTTVEGLVLDRTERLGSSTLPIRSYFITSYSTGLIFERTFRKWLDLIHKPRQGTFPNTYQSINHSVHKKRMGLNNE